MKTASIFITICITAGVLVGCGPTYVRGSEVKELDEYAMSTGLDKRDLETLYDENIKSLMESAIVAKWKAAPEPPVVAIFPIVNETTEHVREQLDALSSKMETQLINGGVATVVDHAQQDALIEEIKTRYDRFMALRDEAVAATKAKRKPLDEKTAADYGVDTAPRLEIVTTTELEARAAGIKVGSVDELMDKLKEAGAV